MLKKAGYTVRLGEFETCPRWARSLDGRASFARKPLARRQLEWFERTAFQAAKVRNVSRLGSHSRPH
jgi:hypothetical protein